MEDNNRRQYERIEKSKTIKIFSDTTKRPGELTVTLISIDVSEGGLQFESGKKYSPGQRHAIRYSDESGAFCDAMIEIMWVKEIISDTLFNIGARFVDTEEELIHKLL